MKERAASKGFLTQVSAVSHFFGWKFKCVTVGLKTTLEEKKEIFPRQNTLPGNVTWKQSACELGKRGTIEP